MSSPIRLVAVTSDHHFGSIFGLAPPVYSVGDGATQNSNRIQGWLWECWEDATGCRWHKAEGVGQPGEIEVGKGWMDEVIGDEPWAWVVNGDLVEGRHHGTVELIHHDVLVHKALAKHVLSPLAEYAHEVIVVRGTECHAKTLESPIAEHLGSRYSKETRDFCWEQVQLRVNGCLTHFKHHIGASMRPWTKSMQLAAALVAEQAEASKLGHEVPRVIVRSHRHEYGQYRSAQGLCVVTPPWQGLTKFARKVTQASLSVPGMVILDYRTLDSDGLPLVHARLYKPDADEVVTL